MLSSFLVSPLKTLYPILPPLCSPTHPLPLPCPLHWGTEPSQDQGFLLSVMSDNAILCYICVWSHESLHVYSLVVCLVPGSSEVLVGSYCCSSYGAVNPFSSLGPFSGSFIRDPVLCPMDGCEHPLLYLSSTSRTSQETDVSGFCQQALVGIHNSV